MPPGACFSCGNGSQENYALIGVTQWDGSFYLCKFCVISAMTIFEDLILPAEETVLRGEIDRLEKQISSKDRQIEKLEKLNESYRMVFNSVNLVAPGSGGSNSDASPLPNGNLPQSVEQVRGLSIDDNGSSGGTDSIRVPGKLESPTRDETDIDRILKATAVGSSGSNESTVESTRSPSESSSGKGSDLSSDFRFPIDEPKLSI